MAASPSSPGAIELFPIFRERIWGRDNLSPFFPSTDGKRIGEVWFTSQENRVVSRGGTLGELLRAHPEILGNAVDPRQPDMCPLLLKLIFTSERLSVQVHPGDDYARRHHQSLGKTEAWYVVDSEPRGEVAVGLRQPITPERFKEAITNGEIVDMLNWRPVRPGSVVYVPAGTVHAIGAGVTICEVQQNCDITYRLYDYGRARELHLEHGLRVSDLEANQPHVFDASARSLRDELVACEYFRIERLRPSTGFAILARPHYMLLLCTQGGGTIAGQQAVAGQAWLIPGNGPDLNVDAAGSEWIVAYTADQPSPALAVD